MTIRFGTITYELLHSQATGWTVLITRDPLLGTDKRVVLARRTVRTQRSGESLIAFLAHRIT